MLGFAPFLGVAVWLDVHRDGEPGLTLPDKPPADVVDYLRESEVVFSVNGKPEAALKRGAYKCLEYVSDISSSSSQGVVFRTFNYPNST
jgi:hypothetical protein